MANERPVIGRPAVPDLSIGNIVAHGDESERMLRLVRMTRSSSYTNSPLYAFELAYITTMAMINGLQSRRDAAVLEPIVDPQNAMALLSFMGTSMATCPAIGGWNPY